MRAGEPVSEVRRRIEDADIDIPLLVDDDGRPRGWLSERALLGERVREELRSGPEPIVELDDVLRDALSDLLAHGAQYGRVVDDRGQGDRRALDRAARPRHRRGGERDRRAARPAQDPRPRDGDVVVRRGQRLLPELDRRQLGPLQDSR